MKCFIECEGQVLVQEQIERVLEEGRVNKAGTLGSTALAEYI